MAKSFYRIPTRTDLRTKFEASYIPEPNSGCWLWVGAACPSRGDYWRGTIFLNGRNRSAYRVSYELHQGPIPAGKMICHRCNNPICVNPDHIYAGTATDNAADRTRSTQFVPKNPINRICPHGHSMAVVGSYLPPGYKTPICGECKRIYKRKYRAKLRLTATAASG